MSESIASPPPQRLTVTHWLIILVAIIGFAFDTYELLMLPLVVRPALLELAQASPGSSAFGNWVGQLFYVPAVAGGIFGLLGGYLTDRLGRRRVLTWSILLYAFSAFASGFSTSALMLLVLRCGTFIGVCVEFVAATAWLAELFPNPQQRERVLGYTQAFSSVGGLMVAWANSQALQHAAQLPTIVLPEWLHSLGSIANGHAPWRYTLMSGLIPAIPLILIRPFLPESPMWQAKKAAGTLKRPRFAELFAPGLCKTTIVTTLMVALSYGAAFGALQHTPRIAPGLPEVKDSSKSLNEKEQRINEEKAGANLTKVQEIGGLGGRVILAVLALLIVSRRWLIRLFQLAGVVIVPLTFGYAVVHSHALFSIDLSAIHAGAYEVTLFELFLFLAGLTTVAQFSFWGNYLPRVYPVHLRGTGESFAANIGGRMIGTMFAWVTSTLATASFIPGGSPPIKLAYVAAGVGAFVYIGGLIAGFLLPEPKEQTMQED